MQRAAYVEPAPFPGGAPRLCRTHCQLLKCLPCLLQLCKQSREMGSEYLLPLPGQPGERNEPLAPTQTAVHVSSRPCSSQRRRSTLPQTPCLPAPVLGEHKDPERPLAGDTTSNLHVLEQTWKGRGFQRMLVPFTTHQTGPGEALLTQMAKAY